MTDSTEARLQEILVSHAICKARACACAVEVLSNCALHFANPELFASIGVDEQQSIDRAIANAQKIIAAYAEAENAELQAKLKEAEQDTKDVYEDYQDAVQKLIAEGEENSRLKYELGATRATLEAYSADAIRQTLENSRLQAQVAQLQEALSDMASGFAERFGYGAPYDYLISCVKEPEGSL